MACKKLQWHVLDVLGLGRDLPLLLSVTVVTSLRGAPAPRSSRLISFFAILISLLYVINIKLISIVHQGKL